MTKRYTKIAVPVALSLFAGAAQAVNVVPNGTFESGLDGWLEFPNGGTIGLAADNGPSAPGSQSAQLVADPSGGGASFPLIKVERLAPGLLTPFADVTVSFDARAPLQTQSFPEIVGGVVFIAELFSEFTEPGGTNEIILGGAPLTTDWQTFVINTTLGADVSGGVSLLFKADCGANPTCRLTANIDNVSIDTAVVPVPAAVWLFGSGLIGLVGVARRKLKAA
jgi:hypothetical protein